MNLTQVLRYLIYCRKSTDAEDRQVQSIEDQERELIQFVRSRSEYKNIKIVHIFKESKSAKAPGRPLFNEMIQMIQDGKADGIICWKINRLLRNPVDGGTVQWLLQQNVIKSIITPGKEYKPTDNALLMSVEQGMANQFILDLKKDVKRGLNSKVEKGWRPGRAPIGYLNDKTGIKGEKQVHKDSERFPIVRRMWDFLLTGQYTISRISRIAADEWGLRTVPTSKHPSQKLCLSAVYSIFTNPFYYGEYSWEGATHQGKHEPMITSEEFDRAQQILGKRGKPRPKYKRLPFNGVVKCGECGAMITSEEKFKLIRSTGETKRYLYHRCTHRKKDIICHQKPITHEALKQQINQYLNSITIPDEFLHWAIDVLRDNHKIEESDRATVMTNLRKNYDSLVKSINNLIKLYVSHENADREILNDEEFKDQKTALVKKNHQSRRR